MSALPLLSLQNVSHQLDGKIILDSISLDVHSGERIALIGPNGAGKSTLLRAMAGIRAGDGIIMAKGGALTALSLQDRARHLAFLPQERRIVWGISVEALVGLGRLPHGMDPAHPSAGDQRAIEAAMLGVDVMAWRTRPATQLSMGEQARVLLARAFASEAPVLLADEPIAALDPKHQLGVLAALSRYAEQGRAVIAVLHELSLAYSWATRVILLDHGRIVADGPPAMVMVPSCLEPVFGIRMSHARVDDLEGILIGASQAQGTG